jgi:BCD family chlorophyll transporter-like MFS transporter
MDRDRLGHNGLALGAWGAAQATAAGLGIALGGALRDGVSALATRGTLGEALATQAAGYEFVYLLEIVLLFVTLAVLGPLVGTARVASVATADGDLVANAG